MSTTGSENHQSKGTCMRPKHALVTAVAAAVALIVAGCSGSSGSTPTTSSTTPTTTSASPTPTTSSTTPSPTPTPTTSTSVPPTTAAVRTDPFTGEKLSAHPVMAVKIDNTVFPQYGITEADILYGEQVEGGLTRLIAIFHTHLPTEVGPVRSMRSTDLQLLPSFGKPLLVASGGAPRWVRALKSSTLVGVTNDAGDPGFWRSNVQRAPYNVHANLQTIAKAYAGKGKAQPMGFHFAATDPRLAKARSVTQISVRMLAGSFQFSYAQGRYLAHHGGTTYVDQHGAKVYVDNVIVQHVHDAPDGQLDPIGNPSYRSTTVGSGKFTLYRNGKAINGTWSRKKEADPTSYVGAGGTAVELKPGTTFVVLAPQTSVMIKG